MATDLGAAKKNIIKTRDDAAPVFLQDAEPEHGEPRFELSPESSASWLKHGSKIGPEKIRPRVEPWLTALCQSEHLSLLVGSGVSHAVSFLATGNGLPGMAPTKFGTLSSVIDAEAARAAKAMGRALPNLEDQLRVANELARGLAIMAPHDEALAQKSKELSGALPTILAEFADGILTGERGLLKAAGPRRESAFNYLVSFLMSFASRTGTRDRLHIFTTNYDRVIESGAEAAGLHLLDRFVGSVAPVFRTSRLDLDIHYNPPGIRGEPRYLEGVARFTKLHGSLDWFEDGESIRRAGIPFGASSVLTYLADSGGGDARRLMIYPNSAKDRETADYPYVDLFRDFAAAACRPNHTLFVFGHSLGDEHISRVLADMLTIPSTHLVVMAYDDPLGRILRLYDQIGRPAQMTLMVGPHIGDFAALVDHYLPKPAIDKTTFRMAELLRARWGASVEDKSGGGDEPSNSDGKKE